MIMLVWEMSKSSKLLFKILMKNIELMMSCEHMENREALWDNLINNLEQERGQNIIEVVAIVRANIEMKTQKVYRKKELSDQIHLNLQHLIEKRISIRLLTMRFSVSHPKD